MGRRNGPIENWTKSFSPVDLATPVQQTHYNETRGPVRFKSGPEWGLTKEICATARSESI